MSETLMAVTKTYETGNPDSLIVIIPSEVRKLLSIERGERFAVKVDERGRVIYERIAWDVVSNRRDFAPKKDEK